MALEVQQQTRFFSYAGMKIPDPNPSQTPDQVLGFLSSLYAELVSATVGEPTIQGKEIIYPIAKAAGSKGA